ncbi:MAG: spiro-SPASM protein [Spirochaetaceae bacterium]|jgi:spiro-SPASM protein|nr:spiro-SPASM protein [Spirochaetaceae bacterium]
MNALSVLYGAGLHKAAHASVFSGKNAIALSMEQAGSFRDTRKTVLLTEDDPAYKPEGLARSCTVLTEAHWTRKKLFDALARLSEGFDLIYFAWADCPFLSPDLAEAIAERHIRYAAEYSYADGWPYGLAPELLAPGTAGILSKILADEDGPVERDAIFSVIQKDINAFDIETEIAPTDLRCHRLSFTADSKRNLLLLSRFVSAGFSGWRDAERLIQERPELLRTLPAFYPVQVSGVCPQTCGICPYPRFSAGEETFMEPDRFERLLDKIAAFSGDGVIDLSLWGEVSLHPEKLDIIRRVLARPDLSLIVETSGIGWKTGDLETLAAEVQARPAGGNRQAPLSWIVSLDAHDPQRYREVRGPGYSEAADTAKTLLRLFPEDAYVQAVRVRGFEDDIERFYRFWKDCGANVIIQKYDYFCGFLPALRASDLSPIRRRPCWHLMRDMPVLLDGRVPLCREDLAVFAGTGGRIGGNVFSDSLEIIWSRGEDLYREHCKAAYPGICAECDEYYTYNF